MKPAILFLLFICSALFSQINQEWVKSYYSAMTGTNQPVLSAVDNSGNLYISGTKTGSGTATDIVTVKYDASTGDTIWSNVYSGPYHELVNAMTYYNNAVYVTGWSYTPNRDIITIKYDAINGNVLWVKTYNGTGNGGDFGFAVTVDNSENVYVTGRSDIGGASKFTTLKYNASGDMYPGWPVIYNAGLSTTFDEAHDVKVDASGNVFITGRSGSTGSIDFLTLKISSTGTVFWAKKYNGTASGDDISLSLVLDNTSENIFVGGYTLQSSGLNDIMIIKYSAINGDSLNAAIFNGISNNHDYLKSMAIDNENNIYATGSSYNNISGYDFVTLKYNSNCQLLWNSGFSGPGKNNDNPYYLTIDTLGNVYVTGSYFNGVALGNDYSTVMYNSSGIQVWTAGYNGFSNGYDAATTVSVDNHGNVFVSGWSALSGVHNIITIKYRQLPNTPSSLSAIADNSRNILLSWTDNSNNESGFRIERSTDGGNNWNPLTSVPANTISFSDTGLVPFSIYHYRMYAYNMFGNSPCSNIANDTAVSDNPIDNINVIISHINSLKNSGIINQGQANALIAKLEAAKEKINQGNYNAAVNQINAFLNQVNAFVNGNILTNGQAQPLINIANYVIQLLGTMNQPHKTEGNSQFMPDDFALHNNYPNPFNPVTVILFDVAKAGYVRLSVYNILGKEITILVNANLEQGRYETRFDGSNLPSGIYFYRYESQFYTAAKRMILVK